MEYFIFMHEYIYEYIYIYILKHKKSACLLSYSVMFVITVQFYCVSHWLCESGVVFAANSLIVSTDNKINKPSFLCSFD